MSEHLKPCPFCNGKAMMMINRGFSKEIISAFVYCGECGVATRSYALKTTAAGAWHRRADKQN